ncbi:GNAT family N-acetyltransferase [Blastococcus sp. SYSU DS0541]
MLADAFTDYAWTRWTVDVHDHEERLRELHCLFLTEVALPFGCVDVGEAEGQLVSVAVWMPGDAVPDDVWARVGPAAAELAGDRASAAEEAEAALALRRPADRHVILASLGVLPHRQGRGIGAATLTPGLDRADQDGLPVHLETSAEPNVRFYRRLGFAITDVVDLPAGGPRTWLMRRRPRAGAVRAAAGRGTRTPGELHLGPPDGGVATPAMCGAGPGHPLPRRAEAAAGALVTGCRPPVATPPDPCRR